MRATNDLLSAQFRKARTAVADRIENLFGLRDYPNEEHDREFRDLIESVSLSREELAAFVAMPESSIGEVKRLFAGRRKIRIGTIGDLPSKAATASRVPAPMRPVPRAVPPSHPVPCAGGRDKTPR